LRENLTVETDIAVVGAGPCGCFSALVAAKSGARLAVFEEHTKFGFPTHCAGHLSLSGLEQLGLKLSSFLIENTFRGAIFFSPSGKKVSIRFPSPVTCVINRALFDQYLANIASKKGVQFFLGSKVKKIVQQQNGSKEVIISMQGKAERIISNVIIDAEGVSSTLLKNAGLKPLNTRMIVKTASAEVNRVNDVENDCVEVYFGSEFADGFYAWIIPKRDGTAKIGLATKNGNPRLCLEKFIKNSRIANGKLRKSRITRISYHSIPLGGPIPKSYAHGFLATGDAASQVKSTTGGGVVMGMTCAQIAGQVAALAVEEDTFSESFLKHYEERWRQKIGLDMKTMLFARKLLNRLSDHEMDKLFSIAIKLRLEESLIQVKNVDFQGKELMRLVKSPSAFAVLAYFLFSALI
jgi:digeranylgeranylglycerophospholipid reductase